MSVRVLLSLHHQLDENLGAPGITLSLAAALRERGCDVTTFGFGEAWPDTNDWSVKHSVLFPYKTAGYLRRRHSDFDVVDMSTGDAHWWPLAKRIWREKRPALVTRSHGLEHAVVERLRAEEARGEITLSRKYGVYNGGLRLHEVTRSLRSADAVVAGNNGDREYMIRNLGVNPTHVEVMPNGVRQEFLDAPRAAAQGGPLRLVWIAWWNRSKGSEELAEALELLVRDQVDFHMRLLGTIASTEEVLASLSQQVRPCVEVVPRYTNSQLPDLVADREVFVFPSRSEGFSMALLEAMALGLVPLATPVGGATFLIDDGVNGVLVPTQNSVQLAAGIKRMAESRLETTAMGQRARETARDLTWSRVADRTIDLYRRAMSRVPRASSE